MVSNIEDPVLAAVVISIITSIVIWVLLQRKSKASSQSKPVVEELNIYPVKSCADIGVKEAIVTLRGFQFDRTFQVVAKGGDGAWEYCTPREKGNAKLFQVQPTLVRGGECIVFTSPDINDDYTLELEGATTTTLSGSVMGDSVFELEDYGDGVALWLERATGIKGCRLVGIGDESFGRKVEVNPDQGDEIPPNLSAPPLSLADEAPFLLTTQESLLDLNSRLVSAGKKKVDTRRFRPNIVISGLQPWEEDSLKRVRIGKVELQVWQRCGRCTMTTIDRDNLGRSGDVLSALSSFRERKNGQRNFGMHIIPVEGSITSGRNKISVGDEVEILEYDDDRRAEWMRLFGTN